MTDVVKRIPAWAFLVLVLGMVLASISIAFARVDASMAVACQRVSALESREAEWDRAMRMLSEKQVEMTEQQKVIASELRALKELYGGP
jgi:hypothetical protein